MFSIFLIISNNFDFLEVFLNPLTRSYGDYGLSACCTAICFGAPFTVSQGFPFPFPCATSLSPEVTCLCLSWLPLSLPEKRCIEIYCFWDFYMPENVSLLLSLLIDSLAGYIILENNFLSEFWRHCFIVFWLPLLLVGKFLPGDRCNVYRVYFFL